MKQATPKLDVQAAEMAGQLSERLSMSHSVAWADFQDIFPEIINRLNREGDTAQLKAALHTEVAESIRALIEEATEESLKAALKKVQGLRRLLAEEAALTPPTQEEPRDQRSRPYWF